jgi:hypothetical protein
MWRRKKQGEQAIPSLYNPSPSYPPNTPLVLWVIWLLYCVSNEQAYSIQRSSVPQWTADRLTARLPEELYHRIGGRGQEKQKPAFETCVLTARTSKILISFTTHRFFLCRPYINFNDKTRLTPSCPSPFSSALFHLYSWSYTRTAIPSIGLSLTLHPLWEPT